MKRIIISCTLIIASLYANACDVCGGGIGSNSNAAIFPEPGNNYISLSYGYKAFRFLGTTLHYKTVTAAGQLAFSKKISANFSLPFSNINSGVNTITGAGDMMLGLSYKAGNFVLGAGVKLPSGKYRSTTSKALDELNFQAGTGSVDYILSASYVRSFEKINFITSASYKFNNANRDNFRFGDIISTTFAVSRNFKSKKFEYIPFLQLKFDGQLVNARDHHLQRGSGGYAMYSMVGLDIRRGNITIGLSGQYATIQDLANKSIKALPTFSATISYTFN